MLRSLLKAAVLGAAFASVACGGDAFTAGSGGGDAGASDDGSGHDSPSVDVISEPPPSCTGDFACVAAVPAGWQGPMEVYAGSAAPPSCTTDFAQSVGAFGVLQAPTPTCGCACGPSTTTCSPPLMSFYDSSTCLTNPLSCASATLMPNACTTVDVRTHCLTGAVLDIDLTPGTSVMGPCAPQPTRDVPPYSWGTQARGCVSTVAPSQVDCTSGQICAPKAEPGFAAKLCISHAGDLLCPGAGYGVKHLYYTSADDTRGCSACTCGPPSGGACDFSVTAYPSSNMMCTGNSVIYGPGTKCAGVAQPADFRLTMNPTSGSCAASTSSPTGTATPSGPVTVCCPL